MINTTLCYLEKDGCYLMMHRVKKEGDLNRGKWIGVGGKFEDRESPEDCAIRETREETGLTLTSYRYCGVVTFISDRWPTEYMTPLFGILSTMVVTGRMSFFSDALGHSGFTGIAIGVLCGAAFPIWWAVGLAVLFAFLFSFVRSKTNQSADTIIGVFSSTAVALGIFIATMGGGSFTKFNKYLIGDILSVTPGEIGLLALVLLAVIVLWCFAANKLVLTAVHPQLASSRGVATARYETLFTVCIAVVVTLAMSWVGLMLMQKVESVTDAEVVVKRPENSELSTENTPVL